MTSADQSTGDKDRVDSTFLAASYAEYAEDLRRFLVGVLKDQDQAAEVLQTTFTRALEGKSPPREESVRGWLFQVAFREALVLKRRRKVHWKSLGGLAWIRPKAAESAEQAASRGEMINKVRGVLETLPAEQRSVVRMRIYEDKTFAQIAEETGTPLGTVLTRMRLALKKLEEQLRPFDR